ncbi:hypothetical protein ACFOUP_16240 [Belliella kenyensis]|uniref:Uncharacterized protein n=1 Tax=Belliella kenyensis TaxID=1472724 RepID=A0ABV8ERU4_9BACT|nr:hypothetical protein [Belliella kenyensis]MCH7403920.1 hypothetical protein [Belliella kenyensis]MDN3602897.1 hypothetical protein [Belliella kenyensis]
MAAVCAYGVLTDLCAGAYIRRVKGLLGGIVGWLVDFRKRLFLFFDDFGSICFGLGMTSPTQHLGI